MHPFIMIVSGEDERGTLEIYDGKLTIRALKQRLTRERSHGDRWAFCEFDGERCEPEQAIAKMLECVG